MKKAHLTKITQNGTSFYVMVEDPRIIVELIPEIEEQTPQEFQRPWVKKRVKEIANYVAGKMPVKGDEKDYVAKGLIPNAPILNIKDGSKLPIKLDEYEEYYIELPTSEKEFKDFRESVEVIDGQHRLRAFSPDFRSQRLKESDQYEMVFSVFYQASRNLKNELFVVTNEKQKTVEANLLRWFKKELNLLGDEEDIYDFVVEKLNKEDSSPLKGRIIVGAEKIKKGYKETQIEKILKNDKVYSTLKGLAGNVKSTDANDVMLNAISSYLKAWENACGIDFQDPSNETATKISGLRYILSIMPSMLDVLITEKSKANTKSFESLINELPNAIGDPEINRPNDIFIVDKLSFRGESATTALSESHGMALKRYRSRKSDGFNPLEN